MKAVIHCKINVCHYGAEEVTVSCAVDQGLIPERARILNFSLGLELGGMVWQNLNWKFLLQKYFWVKSLPVYISTHTLPHNTTFTHKHLPITSFPTYTYIALLRGLLKW